ncbi:MAG: hypothetical protein AMK73_09460, partial [Planctomycetes bacterium SM23_32]
MRAGTALEWALLGCWLLAAAAAAAQEGEEVLIGADYQPRLSEQAKAVFYEAGFNYARLTGGGYDWSLEQHLATTAELEERGVKVLLQLGSHYPSGAYFRFTDSRFVDHKGETGREDRDAWAINYSGKTWPQYSYASEEVRELFERDFTAYLERMKGFGNVVGVCLHNEPGLHWLTDRIFDYSPPALRRFRVWLRERYGDVAALNAAWGTDYESFDAVEPPRDEPPVPNIAAWLDWRRANVDFVAEFLQWEQELVRRVWPGLALTTNMAGPLDWWHAWRCSDNYLFTRGMDIAGVDVYPSEWGPRQFPAYVMDMTNGVAQGRPVHVLECEVYDPEKWPDLSAEQRVAMLRSEMWTYLGHGARGILLWGLAGRGDNNLTDGDFNPRAAAMREIVRTAEALRLGRYRRPPSKVAVVVDPDAYFYFTGSEEEPPYFLDKAMMGLHGAALEAGWQADVIFADQVRGGGAADYDALLLPASVVADQALADTLRRFTEEGGLLVAQAPFAEVDGRGRPYDAWPGAGLDEVFGLRAGESALEPGVIRADGLELSAWRFRRSIEPAGAAVIGRFADGAPALSVHDYGRGRAVYVASCVGMAYCDGWGSWARMGLRDLLASLLAEAAPDGRLPMVTHEGEGLLDVSELRDPDGSRLVVLTVPPHRAEPLDAARD